MIGNKDYQQHGIICKKSCFTNLLATFEDWTSTLDQGYGVDVIYLDYSKAFDSIPHQSLLCKLEAYGICGNLLSWLSNFLSNRLQRVTINGCLSEWTNVQSGVPQGSVLGPLLFILYDPWPYQRRSKNICRRYLNLLCNQKLWWLPQIAKRLEPTITMVHCLATSF